MSDMPAGGGDAGTARPTDERAALARELDEIELLIGQTRAEADRHESRRLAAAQRLEQLLAAAPEALREGHEQLLRQTQRATLMSAQVEVLEGKQKVLRRYAEALQVGGYADGADAGDPAAGGEAAAGGQPAAGNGHRPPSREVLAAQEDLRRLIARQMHDGPAQSIANIALQAQVVQRLLERDPAAAARELDELRRMVQGALEATKTFIFDVRPMVLDDLGLLPTLRRAARERGQRSGIAVQLDSRGQDRRLEPEIESHLFRILDDAVAGYLAGHPAAVGIRLDWTDERITAVVYSTPPEHEAAAPVPTSRVQPGADVPPALAGMIAAHDAEVADRATARRRAFGLPDSLWQALAARAQSVDITLVQADDGLRLEATVVPPASGPA